MTDTANLGLPFIEGSQAQKHVTHNEALRILDATIHIGVLDTTRVSPPTTPVEGERHVVAVGATDVWTGQANTIATYEDGGWRFLTPKLGWCVWSAADNTLFVYDGSIWRNLHDLPTTLDNAVHIGINSSASSPNLLTVRSNAALFNSISAGGDGGTGDMRIQISKESNVKTASVVFSDAFSGRAEFGLIGSDAFRLKVSPDGSAFVDAFIIDQSSGNLTLPRGLALTGIISPLQITTNQNDYAPAGFSAASVLRLSTDANRNITGLAGGSDGRLIYIYNAGSFSVVLQDENALSAAGNRFGFGTSLTLAVKQGATLIYDSAAQRWRQVGSGSDGSIAMFKLTSQVAASSTALTFTGIDSTYREYIFEFDSVLPITNNVQFICEVSDDGGSTWKASAYAGSSFVHNSSGSTAVTSLATAIPLSQAVVSNVAGYGVTGELKLRNPAGTSSRKFIKANTSYRNQVAGGTESVNVGEYWDGGNGALNALRFRYSAGNIANGTITMYGVR